MVCRLHSQFVSCGIFRETGDHCLARAARADGVDHARCALVITVAAPFAVVASRILAAVVVGSVVARISTKAR